jgi:predicted amidophosphoribosyltransferase
MHESVARRLVHLLKYQGIPAAGVILGAVMAKRLPPGTTALIPVPRAMVRRIRYGIDPAIELAYRVGAISGIPVVEALGAPLWWPSHARGDRAARRRPRFRPVAPAPEGSLMVDDVLTTGATLAAAGRILGLKQAITATRADSRWFG